MTNLSHNEIELLKASIQGNTAAFESIVKKYQSYVCAITYSAIPDVEKSEDMAQETFLHVWNNLSKLKDLTKFKSWLITITRNIISDFIQKQKRDLINKAAQIEQIENAKTNQAEPAQEAMTKEQQAVVQSALMQIPEKYREPLVLFYRHEQSVKHIAEQLDLSEELVKQHLSRGRKLLREQVASMVEGAIKRTGPTKAFTTVVMASIAGLAVKGTVATAAVAGTSAIMSSVSAKIIAAAAVIVIGIGSVVTYNHFAKPGNNAQIQTPLVRANEVQQEIKPEISLPASNINIAANTIEESSQPEIAAAIYANNTSNENISSSDTSSINNTIALGRKPVDSSYNYFLFTRYNKESSTKTLVLAHIAGDRIELKDITTQPESKYHWGNPICVAGGKLYCGSYNSFYSIDLETKETGNFPLRPDKTPDYAFNFTSTVLEPCFSDNCIYGLAKKGDITTLRQVDFEKEAYRDIADVTKVQPSRDMAISPDNKRLAYFALDENGYLPSSHDTGHFLTIVDIESGKITQPAKPIEFTVPLGASSFPGIPITWLDSETVAYVRSQAKENEDELSIFTSSVNKLSTTNANTGQTEDILALPRSSGISFAPGLNMDNVGIGPLIQPIPDYQNNYRLDFKNRKLVENDLVAGDYRYAFENLYYKEQDLGSAKSRYYKASPDGKQIIWMSTQTINSNDNQNKESLARFTTAIDYGLLYYHDEALNEPVTIANVFNSSGFWLKDEDLKNLSTKTSLSSEWTPLNNLTNKVPTQPWIDTRKNIRDYLNCKIETDKTSYQLHEPIHVTLTVTNKSNSDITINNPHVIVSVMRPLTGLTLRYPGGLAAINSGAQPYSPLDEDILLKAGESIISTDTIEVSITGDCSLEYKYEMPTIQEEFKGYIVTEPATFDVLPVENPTIERQLFEAKFARIINRFHNDTAMDPNWNGNNNISDNIIGLPGMGPEVAPYIIKTIESETNKYSRQMLLTALCSIADSQYIPYFKERLINAETYPKVCYWLLTTYRNSGSDEVTKQQIIEAFIAGMSNSEIKARQEICSYLTQIYDENIETCLTKAIEDKNEKIRLDAGFYLAAAKWLDLTEWLKFAKSKFDYVNYISSSAVIKKLEQQYNISKRNLPVLSKEDFEIAEKIEESEQQYTKILDDWISWAQENPRASFTFFEDYRETWWENDPLRQE